MAEPTSFNSNTEEGIPIPHPFKTQEIRISSSSPHSAIRIQSSLYSSGPSTRLPRYPKGRYLHLTARAEYRKTQRHGKKPSTSTAKIIRGTPLRALPVPREACLWSGQPWSSLALFFPPLLPSLTNEEGRGFRTQEQHGPAANVTRPQKGCPTPRSRW